MSTVYTVRTLAARWGVHEETIRGYIRAGRLPFFRLGGKLLRIRGVDVDTWENAGGNIASEPTGSGNSTIKPSSSGRTRKARTTATP